MSEFKRMEMVIEAESVWGINRGAELAMSKALENNPSGTQTIAKHGVTVTWRLIDVIKPEDTSEGSIIPEDAPPPAMNIPDLTTMDIEDAKGIVVAAASEDELDIMEEIEKSSNRNPGGRKGVFAFIDRKRAEIKARNEKKARENDEGDE